jgi:hypothetical protein
MAILAIRWPIQAVDQAQAITNRRSRRSLRPVPQTPPGQSMAAQHIPKPLRRQDSRHKPPRHPTSTGAAELGAKAPRCIESAQLFSETCHEDRRCDAASALENQRLTAHFLSGHGRKVLVFRGAVMLEGALGRHTPAVAGPARNPKYDILRIDEVLLSDVVAKPP